jgi:hypothetical protein
VFGSGEGQADAARMERILRELHGGHVPAEMKEKETASVYSTDGAKKV